MHYILAKLRAFFVGYHFSMTIAVDLVAFVLHSKLTVKICALTIPVKI